MCCDRCRMTPIEKVDQITANCVTMETQLSNRRDQRLKSNDRTDQRSERHFNRSSAQPDLRREGRAPRAAFTDGVMGITFSSHSRHRAASSAAQKSTAGALSHTSQIVRIPPRRARGHRPPSIPPTKPPNPSSASPPVGSPRGGASGSSSERGARARGREGAGGSGSNCRGHRSFGRKMWLCDGARGGHCRS
jgi:hypothetical protein